MQTKPSFQRSLDLAILSGFTQTRARQHDDCVFFHRTNPRGVEVTLHDECGNVLDAPESPVWTVQVTKRGFEIYEPEIIGEGLTLPEAIALAATAGEMVLASTVGENTKLAKLWGFEPIATPTGQAFYRVRQSDGKEILVYDVELGIDSPADYETWIVSVEPHEETDGTLTLADALKEASKAIEKVRLLALRFGNAKSVQSVPTIKAARLIWQKTRDHHGLGASQSPRVTVIDVETGETVAWISYNARAWKSDYSKGKAEEITD